MGRKQRRYAAEAYQRGRLTEVKKVTESELRILLRADGDRGRIDRVAILRAIGGSILIGDTRYALKPDSTRYV